MSIDMRCESGDPSSIRSVDHRLCENRLTWFTANLKVFKIKCNIIVLKFSLLFRLNVL